MRGILGTILAGSRQASVESYETVWGRLFGGGPTKSGASVGEGSALAVSAVFGCLRVIGEDISTVPLKLLRVDGRQTQEARELDLHDLMDTSPNPWQTSQEFREMLTWHAALMGAGRAAVLRIGGEVRELLPLLPGQATPERLSNGSFVYRVTTHDGQMFQLAPSDVFEVRGPAWDWDQPIKVLDKAREAIGLAMVTEEAHARLHANGVQPGGVLATDKVLPDDVYKRLRESWEQRYHGMANLFRTVILEAGLKFEKLSMTGVDAEHLATRQHQVVEVCRFFRVHPQKVFGQDKAATFASAEQFALSHVMDCIRPWAVRWDKSADKRLLTKRQRQDGLFFKTRLEALLRGDMKARAEFYKALSSIAGITPEEIRDKEDLPWLPGLDRPFIPLNTGILAADGTIATADSEAL